MARPGSPGAHRAAAPRRCELIGNAAADGADVPATFAEMTRAVALRVRTMLSLVRRRSRPPSATASRSGGVVEFIADFRGG